MTKRVWMSAALGLLVSGCGVAPAVLTLETTDLPASGPGQYAVWASDGEDVAVLLTTFRDNDGAQITLEDPQEVAEILVTVEAAGTPTSPGARIFGGALGDDGADLEFALDPDIVGGVSLWTPTDAGIDDDNQTQGAWFMERVGDDVVPGLSFGPPPPGWSYVAWTETQDWYLPMGSFAAPDEADSDCFFCGEFDVVPVPGEDFLDRLPDEIADDIELADGASGVVVSISPDVYDISPDVYDISPDVYDLEAGGPFRFGLDVLSVSVPAGTPGGELMDLEDSFGPPAGGITIEP